MTSEGLPVTPADREAAVIVLNAMWRAEHGDAACSWMRVEDEATLSGKRDDDWMVQAIVQARLASTPSTGAVPEGMREAIARVLHDTARKYGDVEPFAPPFLNEFADAVSSLFAPAPVPATREGWRTIDEADRSVPLLVGCWVISEDEPTRWSSWTSYPGEGLGEDGTWGDEPTHWRPLPAAPTVAQGEGK